MYLGACSDKYIRFWDMETHHILCSCLYYHVPEESTTGSSTGMGKSDHPSGPDNTHHSDHHKHQQQQQQRVHPRSKLNPQYIPPSHATAPNTPPDEILRTLKVSDSEDMLIGKPLILSFFVSSMKTIRFLIIFHNFIIIYCIFHKIGAYDTGMLRTWSIQSYSIVTLKGLLKKYLTSQNNINSNNTNTDNNNNNQDNKEKIHKNPQIHYTGSIKPTSDTENDAKNPTSGLEAGGMYGFGAMAISPITLLQEWQAHSSPFLSGIVV